MKNLTIAFFIIFLSPTILQAKEDGKKVNYEYKKYEKFDLGGLEIKGDVTTPGDLTVKERKRQVFERELLSRKSYLSEIRKDINNIR